MQPWDIYSTWMSNRGREKECHKESVSEDSRSAFQAVIFSQLFVQDTRTGTSGQSLTCDAFSIIQCLTWDIKYQMFSCQAVKIKTNIDQNKDMNRLNFFIFPQLNSKTFFFFCNNTVKHQRQPSWLQTDVFVMFPWFILDTKLDTNRYNLSYLPR